MFALQFSEGLFYTGPLVLVINFGVSCMRLAPSQSLGLPAMSADFLNCCTAPVFCCQIFWVGDGHFAFTVHLSLSFLYFIPS